MEPLHTPPETSSFVLLADHQSRTPASFHSGPPVLHYHSKQCKLVAYEHDLASIPALNAIRPGSQDQNQTVSEPDANGVDNDEGKEVVIDGVDVWVTSDKFLLYTPTTSKGIAIPYPSISLHAIQRLQPPNSSEEVQGLYMQIANPASASVSRDDDEEDSITITVVPTVTEVPEPSAPADGEEEQPVSATQMFYNAVSACSNLHPDPVLPGDEDDEDEEGDYEDEEGDYDMQDDGVVQLQSGLPPPMPGSSGWITAENMHEYFDEDGNWIAGGQEPSLPLGPGAGTVRQRDESEGEGGAGNAGQAGDGSNNEETKWQRTD